jgi:hypothetical protein
MGMKPTHFSVATSVRTLAGVAAVVACIAGLVGALAPEVASAAKTRSHVVTPGRSISIPLRKHVHLLVPKQAVKSRGRVTVTFLAHGAYSVHVSVPWRPRIRVVARVSGRTRSQLLGGVLFGDSKSSRGVARAHQAVSLTSLIPGRVCIKVGLAVGAAAIETGPFDLGIDGAAVTACLLNLGRNFIGRLVASRIAEALGHDCAAELAKSGVNDVKAVFFKVPQCNEPKGPSGPSDGTPLVIATLTIPSPTGVPITPTKTPSPVPPSPAPTPTPLPTGQYGVMNASGGVYWRSSPDWNAAEATAGNGFYPNTIISVNCYQAGAANVPGTSDGMWEQASWVSGDGRGSGWINEHFINDGAPINQPSPGVPPCASAPPPPPPPAPAASWAETAGGVAHTWTNYTNAGGTEGPSIAGGQTVAIACKLPGFRVADGNTWWYRIASSPWNNSYYVSADAFYNNGSTSGSLHGTPFVDPAVADC